MVAINRQVARRIYEYGVHVTGATTIMRPAAELYTAWKDIRRLPRIVEGLEGVEEFPDGLTRWKTEGPAGHYVWEAQVIADEMHHRIAWQSTSNSPVQNAGTILFEEQAEGRGTVVRVELEYIPPGGKVGHAMSKIWGEDPRTQLHRALHRFRQLMETGELAIGTAPPAGHNRLRRERADDARAPAGTDAPARGSTGESAK